MKLRFLPLAVFLAGCAHRPPETAMPQDLLAALQPMPSPMAIRSTLSLGVVAPRWKLAGTVPAAIILKRPDKSLIRVTGPVGGLLAELVTTPSELSILLASQRLLLQSSQPDVLLREQTGGVLGVDGLLCLLMGHLPPLDLQVSEIHEEGSQTSAVAHLPGGQVIEIHAERSRRSSMDLTGLAVKSPDGEVQLQATWEGRVRVEGESYPTEMSLLVPSLDLTLKLQYREWESLGGYGDVFQVRSPDGLEVMDLQEAIRQAGAPDAEGQPGEGQLQRP